MIRSEPAVHSNDRPITTQPLIPIPAPLPPRVQALSEPLYFRQAGRTEEDVYAEMPVSSGVAHHILISLHPVLFRCSCLLRQRPCIHAHALAVWFNKAGPEDFPRTDALPEWAETLKRGGKAAAARSTGEQDASARRDQRYLERLERAGEGLADLENWLSDLTRRGLATILSESTTPFANIAARMSDASLPGLARLFRNLESGATPDQVAAVASTLGACYLAIRSFHKRAKLPPSLVFDLQTFLGIAIKKEDVLQNGERQEDTWAVLGHCTEPLEERLWQRRTWLLSASGRFALLLDFAFGDGEFGPGFSPGVQLQGTLAFYPSNFPQRAIPAAEPRILTERMSQPAGYGTIEAMATAYAEAIGRQPWLSQFPAVLELIPLPAGSAADPVNKQIPLHVSTQSNWKLVAVSGGRPLHLFGEWDGMSFRPLGYWESPQIYRILHL